MVSGSLFGHSDAFFGEADTPALAPDLPESGFRWHESGPGLVRVIEAHEREVGSGALKAFGGGIYPARDLQLHAFIRRNIQHNLYRIPLR